MLTPLIAGILLAFPVHAADPAFPAMDSCYVVTAGSSLGTAFLVSPDLAVTAAHVVEETDSVTLESGAEQPEQIAAAVIYRDEQEDIAVLRLASSPDVPVLPVSTALPTRGDVAYAVGSPIGQLVASRGLVVAADPTGIEATTPVDHGSSGGPLLAEDGSVLGVVVAESTLTGNSMATSGDAIRRVLAEAEGAPDPPSAAVPTRQTVGIPYWIAVLIPVTFIIAVAALLVSVLTFHRSRSRGRDRIVITLDEE